MEQNKGFTLTEMLVVLAIAGILTSISLTSFLSWKEKSDMENDVKKISSFIQEQRMIAFSRKTSFSCYFSSNGKILYAKDLSDSKIIRIKLKSAFEFNGSNLVIDSRGTMSGASIKPKTLISNSNYDCLAINDTRIKIGKWDGGSGKCSVK